MEFNIDTLRITDCEQEDTYGSGAASAGSSLLSQIKQRNTAQGEAGRATAGWERATPVEGFDLAKPKVQAHVESSKLRQLLNNLPSDDL